MHQSSTNFSEIFAGKRALRLDDQDASILEKLEPYHGVFSFCLPVLSVDLSRSARLVRPVDNATCHDAAGSP
jgi:hypothetical protein